jgi:hypothetical protein
MARFLKRWESVPLFVIPGARDPRDGPQWPVARGSEPGIHEHRSIRGWLRQVFMVSGPGPLGHPGTTPVGVRHFLASPHACTSGPGFFKYCLWTASSIQ